MTWHATCDECKNPFKPDEVVYELRAKSADMIDRPLSGPRTLHFGCIEKWGKRR